MKINTGPGSDFITSGKNISYWTQTVPEQVPHPLTENKETDVVIVGGGMAGITIAYCVLLTGKKVILVEDGMLGSGETGRTTAQIVTSLDERYYNLEKTFGLEKTGLIAESHKMAIDFIEQTIQKEKIICGFKRVSNYLFRHANDKKDSLSAEYKAATKAGLIVKEVNTAPGLLQPERALCFFDQAQFHPLQYILQLSQSVQKYGGEIFTSTRAVHINHEGITTANGCKIKAKHVVVATNSPVNNKFGVLGKMQPYRTYVIGALVKKNALPQAMWTDTGDNTRDAQNAPYHYARLHAYNDQFDLLICGGEDHPTGNTSDNHVPEERRYKTLENWTRYYFPIKEVVYRWSGQVLMPAHGPAFIGHNPRDHKNVYIVTGDGGNGMTHCTIAGMLISDMINGQKNRWEEIYNPSRLRAKNGRLVVKRLWDDVMAYMRQMPNFKSTQQIKEIKNGEGRVVDMREEKFGVYKNETGQVFIVSGICTHLKCSLAWNGDERTWDCPCHGSRYTYEGKVINGPANTNLATYTEINGKLQPQNI